MCTSIGGAVEVKGGRHIQGSMGRDVNSVEKVLLMEDSLSLVHILTIYHVKAASITNIRGGKMNGKVARRLRKRASALCDKTQGNYVVKWYKKLTGKVDDEGKPIMKVTGTIMWPATSFVGTYKRLKREYKEGKSNANVFSRLK